MSFSQKYIFIPMCFIFLSCSPSHDGSDDNASSGIIPNPNPDPVLEAAAIAVFSASCVGCHNGSLSPDLRVASIDSLKDSLYLNIGRGDSSSLYTRMISSGSPMPTSGLLAQVESEKIKDWIDDLGIVPDDTPIAATFSDIETNILIPKCYSCHDGHATYDFGPGGSTSGYDDLLYGFVAPLNLGSTLYSSITSGASGTGNVMPKGQAALSSEEIEAIRSWIMDGALDN